MDNKNNPLNSAITLLLTILLTACGNRQKTFTISDVIQNAESLDGRTIRVRGQAFLWINPSRETMWMSGGCRPDTDPSMPGNVNGWLTLYDQIDMDDLRHYGAPHDDTGIKISKASFHCDGNYCLMTCQGFEAISLRMYEFFGILRVNADSELILENIDLNESSQLVDGEWLPISTGKLQVYFP